MNIEEPVESVDWGEKAHRYYHEAKRLVRRHWWLLLMMVCAGIAVQGYRSLIRDPIYVSQATMIVSGRFALPESVYREELVNFFGTQMDLMRSARVQEAAVERVKMLRPDLEGDWVRLSVSLRPQTSIFILRAEGGRQEYTTLFLDAVMEEYKRFRREMRSQTSETTLLAITEQLYRLEEEINAQEAAVEEFQKQNNLVFLKEQGTTAGSYLAQLKNSQAELQTRLLLLKSLTTKDATHTDPTSLQGGELVTLASQEVIDATREARLDLMRLKAQRDEFAIYLRPRHPKLIDLNMEIERAENFLAIVERQTRASLVEQEQVLSRQIANLDEVIAQWEHTALDISRKSAEFERLSFRLNRSRETYQRLLDSMQSININQQLEQETVEVLEDASRAMAEEVNIPLVLAKGGIGGFVVGGGVLVLLAALDNRIQSSDDLRRRFDLPVVAIIPKEPVNSAGELDLLQIKDERYRFGEGLRTLRSSIVLSNETEHPLRTLVVTSAIPEEGKSTIAANLAVTLSMSGEKVLLVDADLRRGKLKQIFGIKQKTGLTEVLEGQCDLDEVVSETHYTHLSFISCGQRSDQPGELILSQRMFDFVATVREHYTYVIIDSPPLLAVEDTVVISELSDAVLFTVRSGYTAARQISASLDRLGERADKVIGFVLNCADTKGADYYYYKNYDGYYGD